VCIGNDPVFLPRTAHILDQMYTGGYSAVIDVSKFFYQFPTHPDNHPYLGLLHPLTTNEIYEYWGLPMGRPTLLLLQDGMACRLCACSMLVSGNFKGLRWQIVGGLASETGEYDPHKGYGYVLADESGSPAVKKVWVHVDDILIHGDTYDKTALACFLLFAILQL
jgi:hypothetical protein